MGERDAGVPVQLPMLEDTAGKEDVVCEQAEKNNEEMLAEIEGLKAELRKSEQTRQQQANEFARLQMKYEKKKKELSVEKEKCEQIKVEFEREKEKTISKYEKKIDQLIDTNKKFAKDKTELIRQLRARFGEGYELWRSYQEIGADIRQHLSAVFSKDDDFEAFICGSAQTKALEWLWEEAVACFKNGEKDEFIVLVGMYKYSLSLVNKLGSEPLYELLDTRPGDDYRTNCHLVAAGSKKQGHVAEVIIQGYRNIYSGKIEHESIVRLK